MTDATSGVLHLGIDLPPAWREVPTSTWEGAPSTQVPLLTAMRDGVRRDGTPHFVATLFAPLPGADDEIEQVLMASLVVECFSRSDMPGADAPWPADGTIVRGIEIAPGVAADAYRLTVPVFDDELAVGAVATFTTPNLPLVPHLEPGFRQIAASIRLSVSEA